MIQHILTEYYGPDTILGAGDMRVNKRNKNPYFLASGRGNKIYSRLNHGAVEKMLSVKWGAGSSRVRGFASEMQ